MRHLVLVVAFTLLSCAGQPSINTPALLVKKDPLDPSKAAPIVVSDIATNPNRDVISFQVPECEDLIAVREAGAPLSNNPGDAVTGFCSRACAPAKADACATGTSLDRDPATAMSCRSLLLDSATLAAIKQSNPEIFEHIFNGNSEPYFCARAPH